MAHHHHHEDDSYYIDQLCMVGLSGAFGVICLSLYFWQTRMLALMLGPQFHLMVAASGVVLVVLAVVRAVTLWRESQPKISPEADRASTAIGSLPLADAALPSAATTHKHVHTHDHACGHDHSHDCGHDHHHDHHPHEHSHNHAHDHSHDDHDHGWAPWRYVVMLVPVILFLLGLPNEGPKAADHNDDEGRIAALAKDGAQAGLQMGINPWSSLAWLGFSRVLSGDDELGEAMPVNDFGKLVMSADDAHERDFYKGKTVRVLGQFVPDNRDPRFFALVRFSVNCCAADAVGKPIAVFSREPIHELKRDQWAQVEGRVEYAQRGGTWVVRLVTTGPARVRPSNPDVNPYIQSR